jgi:hypothetical protein
MKDFASYHGLTGSVLAQQQDQRMAAMRAIGYSDEGTQPPSETVITIVFLLLLLLLWYEGCSPHRDNVVMLQIDFSEENIPRLGPLVDLTLDKRRTKGTRY